MARTASSKTRFKQQKQQRFNFIPHASEGNGRAALRMYQAQFPDRRMPDHRVFQWLHRQLRETHTFQDIRHGPGRRRAVRSPSLQESILNTVADRPE
ncbi:hypothetical protein TNCV_2863281 [Trichonephila clavipes]|nr:hypothetical protein TNCV_2863281 [Trichonephila clavipes]